MNIKTLKLADLKAAKYNPRKDLKPGDPEFEKLRRSIEKFGYVEPLIVNSRTGMTVVGGHQRLKVLQKLGHTEAECVVVDLPETEEKALNIALNKIEGTWDVPALDALISELKAEDFDVTLTGFDFATEEKGGKDFFNMTEEERDALSEEDEDYKNFLEKFEAKKTTDDCYTPPLVYDAVADWVAKEYKVDRKDFVRPFYPGGDYQKEKYPKGCIVVDNPPFSIESEIVRFYCERKQPFFLFSPGLTIFAGAVKTTPTTALCTYAAITYENGATVQTSFITNLDNPDIIARAVPELTQLINAANEEQLKKKRRTLPKYSYPVNVATAAMINYLSIHDTPLTVFRRECVPITGLDSQKDTGKQIFGGGLLLNSKAAAEKAAAEKAAATRWPLSERELAIIRDLDGEAG